MDSTAVAEYLTTCDYNDYYTHPTSSQNGDAHPSGTTKVTFHGWLHDTRLVSKQFDAIIKQFAYASIDLSQCSFIHRLTRVTAPPCEEVKENIRHNTKILELPHSGADNVKDVTIDFLKTCRYLERVVWNDGGQSRSLGWGVEISNTISQYLSEFLHNAERRKPLNGCRMIVGAQHFVIEAVAEWQKHAGKGKPRYQETTWARSRADHRLTESGARESHVLEVFEIVNSWAWPPQLQSLSYPVPCSKRLPPMRKLTLNGYHWSYSAADSSMIWDFSKLHSLTLRNMNIKQLLTHSTSAMFSNVENFRIVKGTMASVADTKAQELFNCLLMAMKGLKSLKIGHDAWFRILPIDVLTNIGANLRKVHLFRGNGHDSLSTTYIAALASCSPHLEVLKIDFHGTNAECLKFLDSLAGFKHVVHLRLYTSGDVIWVDSVQLPSCTDKDYDTVEQIMSHLHSKKRGEPFKTMQFIHDDAVMPSQWIPSNWKAMGLTAENYNEAFQLWQRNIWWSLERVRVYESHLDATGIYKQWGSERCQGLPREMVDSPAYAEIHDWLVSLADADEL